MFVITVAVWEAAGRRGVIAAYILPTPSSILGKLVEAHATLALHTWVTTVEIVLGFLAAVVIGVLLAMAVVYVPAFEKTFYPWIVATQAVPKVAIGPLFIVWLGFGLVPKVLIAFLIAFFPILIDTVIGLRSVETESLFLLRSMGAGTAKTFWFVRLPNALPNIFGGMKVAITLAVVGAIVGEFIGANEGLGYVLLFANGILDTRLLFAALTIISLLATVLYLLISLLERVCIRWHVSMRTPHAAATM